MSVKRGSTVSHIVQCINKSLCSIIDICLSLFCRLKASFDGCATMREPSVEPGASNGGSSEEEGEGEEHDLSESEGGIV